MVPRLGMILLATLIVALIFTVYLLERRRAVKQKELDELRGHVAGLNVLVDDIKGIADEGGELDPTAELVRLRIHRYKYDWSKINKGGDE